MRYAVLGALGQLGRDLCPLLGGEVTALARDRAELTRPDALKAVLDELAPEVVINCAAYNFVDKAESEPAEAFAVNALGVRSLAGVCRDRNCLLVHFSTDYVFGLDSSRREPLGEKDLPGPVSVYGQSKLAGEYFVRSIVPRHIVIRTCGLYGHHGSGGKGGNLVETMLRLGRSGKPVRVVNDQICTPTPTAALAEATVDLLATGETGLYHLTCAGECSWYTFARTIFEMAGMAVDVRPITSAEFGAAARRPAYSVLACRAAQALGVPPLPEWRAALAEYLRTRPQR